MPSPRRFLACALAVPLILVACAKQAVVAPAEGEAAQVAAPSVEKATPAPGAVDRDFANAPAHIAMLIPADTAIYIQVRSLPRFDTLLGRLAMANTSLGRSIDELGRTLHRMLPGDERHILRDQPIGVAISLPQNRDPELTFVLPLKDMPAYKRSMKIGPRMPQPIFDGSYMAVTNAEQFDRPREPVALALGDADHLMVVRMDLPRLDRRYGSQLRLALTALASGAKGEQLDMLPSEPTLRALLQGLADPVLYALAVGQQLETTLDVSGDRIQLLCSVMTRDAGVLSAWTSTAPVDLAPFARSLVASDTISFVGGCDPSVFAGRVAALITDADEDRERVSKMLESFSGLFGSLGAASASFSAGGSHLALHVRATDDPAFARNLASTFELFSRSGLGVAVQSKRVSTVEGVDVEDLLVHFDAASMCRITGEHAADLSAVQLRLDTVAASLFGADTVRVRIARFGDRGLIAIGNDDVWFRRTLYWDKVDTDLTPPDMRVSLEHLGSTRAAAIVRLDLARWSQDREDWLQQWRAIAEPVPMLRPPGEGSVQALDPQPLTLHLGAEGRTLRIGLSIGLSIDRSAEMARR